MEMVNTGHSPVAVLKAIFLKLVLALMLQTGAADDFPNALYGKSLHLVPMMIPPVPSDIISLVDPI